MHFSLFSLKKYLEHANVVQLETDQACDTSTLRTETRISGKENMLYLIIISNKQHVEANRNRIRPNLSVAHLAFFSLCVCYVHISWFY